MKNEDDLIINIRKYYKSSCDLVNAFGGPSVYFHNQSLMECELNFLSDRHVEMIYATLASWGMHRMGNTRTKMEEFADFKQSIVNQRNRLQELVHLKMESCAPEHYEGYLNRLKDIYRILKVSISGTTIVAHSKTLAHIFPNLVPPIDKHHTIRFFTYDNEEFFTKSGKYKQIKLPSDDGTVETQFTDFKKYSCLIKMLFDRCDRQLFTISKDKPSYNTSYPKIMDNLIMAFVKNVPKPKK